MTAERKDTAEERKTYGELGVVLFRMDKADPDTAGLRTWKEAKPEYTKRARWLWRALQRHGYAIVPAATPPEEPAVD